MDCASRLAPLHHVHATIYLGDIDGTTNHAGFIDAICGVLKPSAVQSIHLTLLPRYPTSIYGYQIGPREYLLKGLSVLGHKLDSLRTIKITLMDDIHTGHDSDWWSHEAQPFLSNASQRRDLVFDVQHSKCKHYLWCSYNVHYGDPNINSGAFPWAQQ